MGPSELLSGGLVAGILVVGLASLVVDRPWWHQWWGGLSERLDPVRERHPALVPAVVLVGLVGFGLYARDRQSIPVTALWIVLPGCRRSAGSGAARRGPFPPRGRSSGGRRPATAARCVPYAPGRIVAESAAQRRTSPPRDQSGAWAAATGLPAWTPERPGRSVRRGRSRSSRARSRR